MKQRMNEGKKAPAKIAAKLSPGGGGRGSALLAPAATSMECSGWEGAQRAPNVLTPLQTFQRAAPGQAGLQENLSASPPLLRDFQTKSLPRCLELCGCRIQISVGHSGS